MRTTCVATGLDGGHAVNALPQTAGARVNCRILPGQTPEEVQAILRRVVDDDKVTISITDAHGGSPMSPLRDDVLAATKRLTSQFWPGVVTLPYMVMGGTDGRMLRQAGIPTYGVQGIFFDAATSASTAGTSAWACASSTKGRSSCTGSSRSSRNDRPGQMLSGDLVAERAAARLGIPARLQRRTDGRLQGLDHAAVGGRAVLRPDLHREVEDQLARAPPGRDTEIERALIPLPQTIQPWRDAHA